MTSVSFIIPLINEAANVRGAVDSAWRAGASEVIVVDGGSRDGTLEIAGELDCTLLHSVAGRAVQQNAGAEAASGDVLFFQHADARLASDGARQITAAITAGATWGAFAQSIDQWGFLYRALEWGNAARVRRLGRVYGDQGIFVMRALFHHVGGFPDVPLMEDLLLSHKLRRRAWPQLLVGPLRISARRWRENGVIRQTLKNWTILSLHKLGMSPAALARLYPRHDAASSAGQPSS